MSCNFKSLKEQAEKFGKELKAINNTIRDCLKIGTVLNSEETKSLEKTIEDLTKEWNNFQKELSSLLELMEKISDEEGKRILNKLRKEILVGNLSKRLEEIEKTGFKIGKKASDSFQKTFKQNRFKILENTRLGNFDQVIYILERIFFGVEEQHISTPIELIEILADPLVPLEIKKSVVYLFLASFDKAVDSKKQNQEG